MTKDQITAKVQGYENQSKVLPAMGQALLKAVPKKEK